MQPDVVFMPDMLPVSAMTDPSAPCMKVGRIVAKTDCLVHALPLAPPSGLASGLFIFCTHLACGLVACSI